MAVKPGSPAVRPGQGGGRSGPRPVTHVVENHRGVIAHIRGGESEPLGVGADERLDEDSVYRAYEALEPRRWGAGAQKFGSAPYRAPITSCNCAVSTNCWKLVTLPSRILNTWHTCASKLLPVALTVPV
jgi:hypothetical protein